MTCDNSPAFKCQSRSEAFTSIRFDDACRLEIRWHVEAVTRFPFENSHVRLLATHRRKPPQFFRGPFHHTLAWIEARQREGFTIRFATSRDKHFRMLAGTYIERDGHPRKVRLRISRNSRRRDKRAKMAALFRNGVV